MRRLLLGLATLAAAGVFGAVGLTLALVGLGLPYLVATAAAALLTGGGAYAVLDALVARPLSSLGTEAPSALSRTIGEQRARLATLEGITSSLRHDLRGLLSPAMLVSDRLLANADPKVVKAGETIVRSITRASERLTATRAPSPEAIPPQNSQLRPAATTMQDRGGVTTRTAGKAD